RSRGRRGDLGTLGAGLRDYGDDRHGRNAVLGRQDVRLDVDRDHDGRRDGDDRIADGPAGGALEARRPGRKGTDSATGQVPWPGGRGTDLVTNPGPGTSPAGRLRGAQRCPAGAVATPALHIHTASSS